MEIKVVKLTQLLELRRIKHGHAPPADIDDPLVAQLPDDTVCMHRRDAERLANLLLGQRHFKRIAPCSAYDGKAFTQFRTTWASRLVAGRCPTLTIHSRNIAASISVSRHSTSATFGRCSRQGAQGRVTDEAKRRRDQSDQIVVHPVQMQALEVRDVARDMNREDLSLAADCRFGADAKAFDDQTAVRRALAIGYNGSASFPMSNGNRKCADRSDVRVIQS